ncbi:hypothetical protein [Streptomyces albireticuli]|uniref:Uncharacterized protein n=1 Tax=Streptomyces albireticuli TaxID=1940 RepID=A0A2A2D616_9ACTN|nr:hypothetical protein [Streptomyces albireticuli]MCD9145999.1 hypothetical protein [Streptomyces albireticuli]MCD9165807.1 hypothetical protein [Streptomyces albireticuli]MCD9196024.1 hypothetical protein [Streptomyces albireticuli]PAU46887.1 hypothetical protein CK936_21530 [Streptomyces albireticuli]
MLRTITLRHPLDAAGLPRWQVPARPAESSMAPAGQDRQAADRFRATHGDCTTWGPADYESYEHLVEAADPGIARAVREDLVVVGRHAEGGRVVVDLALPGTRTAAPRGGRLA